MAKRSKQRSYGVHPGVLMGQRIVENMSQKTGKSLRQWAAVVKKSSLKDAYRFMVISPDACRKGIESSNEIRFLRSLPFSIE